MVEVICDTSFLIHLATHRIRNLDEIIIDLGSLSFLVPNVVYHELENLQKHSNKKYEIQRTLEFIKKFRRLPINGTYADKEILNFIKYNRSFVGTMDKELKKNLKFFGCNVISFKNNYIILEN